MRTVRNDTQGAVMVIAVFMAMIVIGFLYYLVGLGDAILAQERMQDAADATAFSSAVIHARGMNVLALMNIIMASLMAVLVLLSMISSLLQVAAAALIAIGFFFPAALAGVTPLRTQAKIVSKAERSLAPSVNKLVGVIHKLQKPLNRAIPMLANVNAMKLARESYSPVVSGALTFPILKALPTVEGKFETLCTKAGEYAGLIATFPIRAILGFLPEFARGRVNDFLVSNAKDLGGKYARFYCGIGEKPSAPSFSVEKGVPELGSEDQRACEFKKKKMTDAELDRRDRACDAYQKEMESIKDGFDFENGECTASGKDKLNCLKMIRLARRDCNPNTFGGRTKYQWREAEVTRHYVLRGSGEGRYVEELTDEEDDIGEERVRDRVGFASGANMCKIGVGLPWVENEYGEWNTDVNLPVCTTEIDVPTAEKMILAGQTRVSRTHKAITHILHCAKHVKMEAEFDGGGFAKDLKKQKPQEMCSCAIAGDNLFQVRSVVLGDPKAYTKKSDKHILVATGGVAPEKTVLGSMGKWTGRIAAAQAEYYFDGTEASSEWLWHMKWKARMRRLQMRPDYECKAKKDTCDRQESGATSGARKKLETLLGDSAATIISH